MKTRNAAQLNMISACIHTAESNAALWADMHGFADSIKTLKSLKEEIIAGLGTAKTTVIPFTTAKRERRKKAEAGTLHLALALMSYAGKTGNEPLLQKARLSASELAHGSGAAMIGLAKNRLALAEELPPDTLAAWDVSAATLGELKGDIALFSEAIGVPRERVLHIRQAREHIKSLLKEAVRVLREEIDPAARIVSFRHPHFLDTWMHARKLVDPRRTRALAVKVLDAVSGLPVKKALLALLPGSLQRRSTNAGNMYVQNLVPGSYTAQVSHPGYAASEVQFAVLAGSTTGLQIVLTPKG